VASQLLTVPEVAERLRRSPRQIYWMRHTGTGPRGAVLSGRLMFREQDIEDWITAQFEGDAPETQGGQVEASRLAAPRSRTAAQPPPGRQGRGGRQGAGAT